VFVDRQNAPGGGYVYAGFSAHCDSGGSHGWVMGFDGNLTKQAPPFDAAPDGAGAGIWQAGQAPVWFRSHPDGADYLFVNTGNALAGSKPKLSQSVLKLKVGASGELTVADSFTPYNRAFLDSCDGDLSAAGPMMLRDKKHIVTGGKQGVLYVLDVDNLGHGNAPDPGGQPGDCTNTAYGIFGLVYNSMHWNSAGDAVFQEFVGGKGHVHGSPVSAIGKDKKLRVYVWTERDNLKAYTQLAGGKFSTQPVVNVSVPTTPSHPGADHPAMPGGMLSLSASPGLAGNVIVWATYPASDAFNPDYLPGVHGMLYAFDGADVTKLLWSSEMVPGDALGEYAKFTPPTIANGRVYVATFEGKLQVYGLLTKSNKNACGGSTKLSHLPGSLCQIGNQCGSWTCAGLNSLKCNTSKGSQNVCGGCLPVVTPTPGHGPGDPCICDPQKAESGHLVCSVDKKSLLCCPCGSAKGCGPGSP
jgi:hypothetical protein